MFTVTFPLDIGTFVRTKDGLIGVVACYQAVTDTEPDEHIIMVSGYKEAWCSEELFSELEVLTENEIERIVDRYKK